MIKSGLGVGVHVVVEREFYSYGFFGSYMLSLSQILFLAISFFTKLSRETSHSFCSPLQLFPEMYCWKWMNSKLWRSAVCVWNPPKCKPNTARREMERSSWIFLILDFRALKFDSFHFQCSFFFLLIGFGMFSTGGPVRGLGRLPIRHVFESAIGLWHDMVKSNSCIGSLLLAIECHHQTRIIRGKISTN